MTKHTDIRTKNAVSNLTFNGHILKLPPPLHDYNVDSFLTIGHIRKIVNRVIAVWKGAEITWYQKRYNIKIISILSFVILLISNFCQNDHLENFQIWSPKTPISETNAKQRMDESLGNLISVVKWRNFNSISDCVFVNFATNHLCVWVEILLTWN